MVLDIDEGSSLVRESVRPLALLAMKGCEEMGNKVNNYLLRWTTNPEDERLLTFPGYKKDSFLIDATCPRFGTGEGKGIINQSVRGYDMFILCDVTNYNITFPMYNLESPMSPDDHFCDLKRLIAAAGCKPYRITVIMPFLYEGRQHRRDGRESLDCAIALQDLFAMGVSNVLTFDAHDPRVQNAAPTNNFDNVPPYYQMLKALFRCYPDIVVHKDHTMVISPDEGAAPRNIYYASMLGIDMGLFYKRRDYSTIIGGRNPIVAHEYLGASVEGKDIIIADDMISTGESMLDIAKELKRRKAKRIFLASTFALFTGGLTAFDKAHRDGLFDMLFATNLTFLNPELKAMPWFREVDMSKYIALLITTLNHDSSLSSLLSPNDKIEQLIECHDSAKT